MTLAIIDREAKILTFRKNSQYYHYSFFPRGGRLLNSDKAQRIWLAMKFLRARLLEVHALPQSIVYLSPRSGGYTQRYILVAAVSAGNTSH